MHQLHLYFTTAFSNDNPARQILAIGPATEAMYYHLLSSLTLFLLFIVSPCVAVPLVTFLSKTAQAIFNLRYASNFFY